MRKKYYYILTTILLFAACSDQIVSECDDADGPMQAAGVTFTQIQDDILTLSCAKVGCHAGSFPSAGLDLTPGARERLVNVNSSQRPELLLVNPGDSENSYLIHKLTANNTSVMPPNNPLDEALIDSIRTWIDLGALNN